jgi:DNA-binding winged helix-turn-helix (wHTH) protein/tetratricopeptide (TPR) repeat protein
MRSPVQSSGVLRFDSYTVDLRTAELFRDGRKIRLQEQPFWILAILLERPGQVVTREELRERLWPADIFVDFDHSLSTAVKKLRQALHDEPDQPQLIETLPRRGYRFIGPAVENLPDPEATNAPLANSPLTTSESRRGTQSRGSTDVPRSSGIRWRVIAPMALLAAALGLGALFRFHRAPLLTEKDTIVVADFVNATGDAVFDNTLRQGLAVQLEQSPFLSLVSEERIRQTLRLMGHPDDSRLTPQIARELCQRTESTAELEGSVAQVGVQYILILRAVNCASGRTLATSEAQASDKNHVLNALEKISLEMRNRLGESLSTVEKFKTPLEEATTASLEALEAYSLGWKTAWRGDFTAAIPLYQRALQLDPNFAMAYAALAPCYRNLGEFKMAEETTRKAYELRERVSQRERFNIEADYYRGVTGDQEKARKAYELWALTYTNDSVPPTVLCVIYNEFGQYDKALAEIREAIRLNPASGLIHAKLAQDYLFVNHFDDAQTTLAQAQAKKLDSAALHFQAYAIAFLQNDASRMARELAWAAGRPGVEDVLLDLEADSNAYFGRVQVAEQFSRRAVASAERAEQKETAGSYEAEAAVREALYGKANEARQRATAGLALSPNRDVLGQIALALALAGDTDRAQAIVDDLGKRFREDTFVQFSYLPTVRAAIVLNRNGPATASGTGSAKALEFLEIAAPYELGTAEALQPIYVRGQAYLAAKRGGEAANEFQKILDHRGIVRNGVLGALAHLGLARAYVVQGDAGKGRDAYQDFLTLWKDADSGVPVLKQAKAEYARLP